MKCSVCGLDPCETPGTCTWESDSWKTAATDYAEHRPPLYDGKGNGTTPLGVRIKTSAEFIANFTPPDFLTDRLLIQSFLYSLTGQTGSGKTAIALRLAASVAMGIPFAGLETTQRRVLYLAAENPIDVQMRWIALAQQMGFDAETIPVFFVEGVFKISEIGKLNAEALRVGGNFGLVIIDTGPPFYEGDDANDRVQMLRAARTFRDLIDGVPGKPTILVNMHPIKNANGDNLIPAGGGSFLNEIDGNLTASKDDAAVTLHWQGKFRGIEFNPLNFQIRAVTHERLKDKKGKLIPTVIAEHLSETAKEDMEKAAFEDWKTVLHHMQTDPDISLNALATRMGWIGPDERPLKWKSQYVTGRMIHAKLIKRSPMKKWEITSTGEEALKSSTGGRV